MKKINFGLLMRTLAFSAMFLSFFAATVTAQNRESAAGQISDISYPENGESLLSSLFTQATGRHSITVRNNSGSDAIVKVEDNYSGETYRLIFVRKDHTYTIDQIRDGSFILKFVLGADYSPSKRMFLKTGSVMQFDTPRNFQMTTFREGNTITTRYSRLSVTLAPVVGGTAQTSKISLKDF